MKNISTETCLYRDVFIFHNFTGANKQTRIKFRKGHKSWAESGSVYVRCLHAYTCITQLMPPDIIGRKQPHMILLARFVFIYSVFNVVVNIMELRFTCRPTRTALCHWTYTLSLSRTYQRNIFPILNIICELNSWKCLLYDMLYKLAANIFHYAGWFYKSIVYR